MIYFILEKDGGSTGARGGGGRRRRQHTEAGGGRGGLTLVIVQLTKLSIVLVISDYFDKYTLFLFGIFLD
jgi:hypothetical protein